MRKPTRQRKNPGRLSVGQAPVDTDIGTVASHAFYRGSPYHKDTPSFVENMPRPRPDASVCPRDLAYRQEDVQRWLREGIAAGNFSDYWVRGFPKYVWHREGVVVFEG